jgi:hypothetical protein
MFKPKLPIAFASTLALVLTACGTTSPGSLAYYVGVGYTNVTTSCGGGYQVYRVGGEQRLLVAAYAVSQAYKAMCEDSRGAAAARPGFAEAVGEYIEKAPDLKGCTIASAVEITPLHTEFTLACPATPGVAISAKA